MCYSLSCVRLFVTPWTAPSRLLCPWDVPGKNTGVWVAIPFSRDLPNPGIKPSLLHCRQILYCLSHQGSLRILEWVAYPFSRGSSQSRNQTALQEDPLPAELLGKPLAHTSISEPPVTFASLLSLTSISPIHLCREGGKNSQVNSP